MSIYIVHTRDISNVMDKSMVECVSIKYQYKYMTVTDEYCYEFDNHYHY